MDTSTSSSVVQMPETMTRGIVDFVLNRVVISEIAVSPTDWLAILRAVRERCKPYLKHLGSFKELRYWLNCSKPVERITKPEVSNITPPLSEHTRCVNLVDMSEIKASSIEVEMLEVEQHAVVAQLKRKTLFLTDGGDFCLWTGDYKLIGSAEGLSGGPEYCVRTGQRESAVVSMCLLLDDDQFVGLLGDTIFSASRPTFLGKRILDALQICFHCEAAKRFKWAEDLEQVAEQLSRIGSTIH